VIERRPSRWPWVLIAALVIGGGVLLAGGGEDDGERAGPAPTVGIELDEEEDPPPTTVPGVLVASGKLLVGDGDRFTTFDLDTGRAAVVGIPPLDGFVEQQPLVVVDDLVIVRRFVAYSIDRAFRSGPEWLGPASVVVPAETGFMWLVDLRTNNAVRASGDGRMREPPITLPDGAWSVHGLADGLVLSSRERWLLVDEAGSVVREQEGEALSAVGDTIVWLDSGCGGRSCSMHITLGDEDFHTVELSALPFVSIHEAVLSPDERLLAVGGDLSGDRSSYEVMVLDLRRADPPLLVAENLDTPPGVMSWSLDARWLFWSRRRFGTTESSFTAYDTRRDETHEVDLPVRNIVTFVAY
jgi:hypothetical protein